MKNPYTYKYKYQPVQGFGHCSRGDFACILSNLSLYDPLFPIPKTSWN